MTLPLVLVSSGRQCLLHLQAAADQRLFCSCSRQLYTADASNTSEAIRSILWKPGQRNHQQQRQRNGDNIFAADVELAAKIRQFRKEPLFGNPYATYTSTPSAQQSRLGMPPRIPSQSEMHRAYMNMPLSRQNIRFNPWSLILELLDDPRVEINASNPVVLRGRALLATIARLGQVTPDNMLTQRPLLARYVQSSKAFVPLPQREDTDSDIVLTSSQHAALSQIQFPRFIANKYTTHVSVVALPEKMEGSNAARRAQWDRSWLSANLTILELQATFLKHRVLFGKRLDMAQQSRLLISNAFEHAPGLVLNVIMSWNDDYRKILTPYAIQRLCAACFSNPDTIREAIVQAWQMYDWLIYHSPALRRNNNNIGVGNAYAVAVKLFRSLESFDNLAEAHNCFHRVQASRPNPSDARMMRLLASDRKLLTRYMNIVAQLRGHWRPKPAATATHRHGIH